EAEGGCPADGFVPGVDALKRERAARVEAQVAVDALAALRSECVIEAAVELTDPRPPLVTDNAVATGGHPAVGALGNHSQSLGSVRGDDQRHPRVLGWF